MHAIDAQLVSALASLIMAIAALVWAVRRRA